MRYNSEEFESLQKEKKLAGLEKIPEEGESKNKEIVSQEIKDREIEDEASNKDEKP